MLMAGVKLGFSNVESDDSCQLCHNNFPALGSSMSPLYLPSWSISGRGGGGGTVSEEGILWHNKKVFSWPSLTYKMTSSFKHWVASHLVQILIVVLIIGILYWKQTLCDQNLQLYPWSSLVVVGDEGWMDPSGKLLCLCLTKKITQHMHSIIPTKELHVLPPSSILQAILN